MAYRNEPVSLEYDDDDILDQIAVDDQPPSYPYGCQFTLAEDDLEQAVGETGKVGEELRFSAMADVTSAYVGDGGSRVELAICEFAGEDGHFFEIAPYPAGKDEEPWNRFGCICLTGSELEKLGLDAADAEVGDTIHLIGDACIKGISRNEDRGEVVTLQITRLTYEDESAESREG